MPIYDFKCSICDFITEELVSLDIEEINCPICSHKALKQFSSQVSFRGLPNPPRYKNYFPTED